ncbi:Uncharacterised protein [Mycobacterium tuberculosis]|nr:Uncharacterised protein [Mycobacterium tuberculosis]
MTGRWVGQLRRQQRGRVEPQVGERGADERLHELTRQQVHHVCLEERARRQRLTQRHDIGVDQRDGLPHTLFAVFDDSQHPVELVQRRAQLLAVLSDEAPQLFGHRRDVRPDPVQGGALGAQLRQDHIRVAHQADDLVGAVGQHPGGFGRVGQQAAQLVVALIEGLGEPGHPVYGVAEVRRRIGKGLRQGGQRFGQPLGVQPADRGGQIAKGVGQLVGRRGPLDRDRRIESAVPAGGDVEELAAQQALGFDCHFGAVSESDVGVDLELHQHARSVERDAGHLSHRIAGDLDGVAGAQPAGVGEIGGDPGALVEKRQPLVLQRGQRNGGDDDDADCADGQTVAFGEGFHFGAHRPLS